MTVFPVGHGAGGFVPEGRQEPSHYVVRVGRTGERLTDAEFGTWLLAHRPDAGDQRPDGEQHLAGLLRRGVLVEVTDPVAFAQQYKLTPLFLGLGNDPGDPDRFAIGVPGLEPLAVVSPAEFELWQWGWVAPSLWAHCEVLATIRAQEAGGPATPDAHLGTVLDALPALLEGFVAYLEPVTSPPPPRHPSAASAGR